MKRKLKLFFNENKKLVAERGEPYSKYIFTSELQNSSKSSEIRKLKDTLLNDKRIIRLIRNLYDKKSGIQSLGASAASYKVYGSFYWVLRFLADIGLSRNELPLDDAIKFIFLNQMPDGQFTIGYRRRNRITITAVCMTAHLLYSIGKLGYVNTRAFNAGLNYILTTQRNDCGWHCDWRKQPGEKDENAPSCPVAGLHVVHALSLFRDKYAALLNRAIQNILRFSHNDEPALITCDMGATGIVRKLRYPPHYMGMDILNILDAVSNYPAHSNNSAFDEMIQSVLDRWNGAGFLKSEKTIPEWKDFDFGRNKCESSWISALFCRVLMRIYIA